MLSIENQMIALHRQPPDAKHACDGSGRRRKADFVAIDVRSGGSPKAGLGNPGFGRLVGGSWPAAKRMASPQSRGVGRFGSVEERLGIDRGGLGRVPDGIDPAAGFGRLAEIELERLSAAGAAAGRRRWPAGFEG